MINVAVGVILEYSLQRIASHAPIMSPSQGIQSTHGDDTHRNTTQAVAQAIELHK